MKSDGNIRTENEELQDAIFDVIQQVLQNSHDRDRNQVNNLMLERFKPTKHKKAYKIDRNLKKRCYAR